MFCGRPVVWTEPSNVPLGLAWVSRLSCRVAVVVPAGGGRALGATVIEAEIGEPTKKLARAALGSSGREPSNRETSMR